MPGIREELVARLGGRRFGVVGVGNVIRGDDGAGPEIVARIAGRVALPAVDASEVPENYGGWVLKQGLESVLFVDAVDFGGEPGEVRLIPIERLMVSASSTHRLSLHFVIQYLTEVWEGDPVLAAVQPKSLEVGEPLSAEVERGVEELAEAIAAAAGAPRR